MSIRSTKKRAECTANNAGASISDALIATQLTPGTKLSRMTKKPRMKTPLHIPAKSVGLRVISEVMQNIKYNNIK